MRPLAKRARRKGERCAKLAIVSCDFSASTAQHSTASVAAGCHCELLAWEIAAPTSEAEREGWRHERRTNTDCSTIAVELRGSEPFSSPPKYEGHRHRDPTASFKRKKPLLLLGACNAFVGLGHCCRLSTTVLSRRTQQAYDCARCCLTHLHVARRRAGDVSNMLS